ncbi:hypothetical protein EDD11_004859 [Mortierella claussenii]|nr:hypothetical protein EDD11_004859 [Mortierella claussenii]
MSSSFCDVPSLRHVKSVREIAQLAAFGNYGRKMKPLTHHVSFSNVDFLEGGLYAFRTELTAREDEVSEVSLFEPDETKFCFYILGQIEQSATGDDIGLPKSTGYVEEVSNIECRCVDVVVKFEHDSGGYIGTF